MDRVVGVPLHISSEYNSAALLHRKSAHCDVKYVRTVTRVTVIPVLQLFRSVLSAFVSASSVMWGENWWHMWRDSQISV